MPLGLGLCFWVGLIFGVLFSEVGTAVTKLTFCHTYPYSEEFPAFPYFPHFSPPLSFFEEFGTFRPFAAFSLLLPILPIFRTFRPYCPFSLNLLNFDENAHFR